MTDAESERGTSRRAFLAAAGTAVTAGCAGLDNGVSDSEPERTGQPEAPQFTLGNVEWEKMHSRVGASFVVKNNRFGGGTAYAEVTLYWNHDVAFQRVVACPLEGGQSEWFASYWDTTPKKRREIDHYDVRLVDGGDIDD